MSSVMNSLSPNSHLFDKINGLNGNAKHSEHTAEDGTAAGVQDRFLKLFIANLNNQDPTKPMETAQIAGQMAHISQVTGIEKQTKILEKQNQLLQEFVEGTNTSRAIQMIGREVIVQGNQLSWQGDGKKVEGDGKKVEGDGKKVEGALALESQADQVTVTIKNASGKAVDQIILNRIAAGVTPFAWDGRDHTGKPLPAGQYTFDVMALAMAQNGTSTNVAATPYMKQRVDAVSWASGNEQLVLHNGSSVNRSAVIQLS